MRPLLALASAAMMLCPPQAAGQVARGEGDFEFFLDVASIPLPDGRVLELIQVAIPSKEIQYSEMDGAWKAAIQVTLRIMQGDSTVHERGLVIRDSRDARPVVTDLSGFIHFSDSSTVAPGSYELTVQIDDLMRRKKSLMGLLRKQYLFSRIEGLALEVPAFPADRVALGDPVLIWSREAGGQFVPNPMQIYGLKNDTLTFFASAYLPPQQAPDSFGVQITIIDQKGEVVGSRTGRTPVRHGRVLVASSFDVNTLPAGNYRLNIGLFEQHTLVAVTGKEFSVAWELMNWQKPRRDVLVEARILFDDSEFDSFRRLGIGEQERLLSDHWKAVDPTPHTAVNELYDIFQNRMAHADAHFRGQDVRGALSDRGLLYIRLGPPDEIIQESVPFNREDLGEALDKLEDRFKVVIHSTTKGPGTEYAVLQDVSSATNRPYRGGGADTGGFELWIYTLRGDPLLERDRVMTVDSGIRYLFVDKDGVGNYRLVGTSEEKEGVEEPASSPE
jgi:GWxTD domain-containing protein